MSEKTLPVDWIEKNLCFIEAALKGQIEIRIGLACLRDLRKQIKELHEDQPGMPVVFREKEFAR